MEPPQESDLPVQVVRLNGARPARETLPGRPTEPGAALDGGVLDLLPAPLLPLLVGGPVDPRRAVAADRLRAKPGVELSGPVEICLVEVMTTEGLDGVAEVAQQLRVLPAHDVRHGGGDEAARSQVSRDPAGE